MALSALVEIWNVINQDMTGFFYYIPLLCRAAAIALAAPFAFFIALDIIAYAIARTLHLSMSSLRVPRSPSVPTSLLSPGQEDRPGHHNITQIPAAQRRNSGRGQHSGKHPIPLSMFTSQHRTDSPIGPVSAQGLALALEDDLVTPDSSRPASAYNSTTSLQSFASSSSTTVSESSTTSTSSSNGPLGHFETRFPPGGRKTSFRQSSYTRPAESLDNLDTPPASEPAKALSDYNAQSSALDIHNSYPSLVPSPERQERAANRRPFRVPV